MTRFFVDAAGRYLGGFDGAAPPAGAVEVDGPPPHGLMKRDGAAWVDTPESIAAKAPPLALEAVVRALKVTGTLTDADLDAPRAPAEGVAK